MKYDKPTQYFYILIIKKSVDVKFSAHDPFSGGNAHYLKIGKQNNFK